jgi:hypothetical protein
MGAGARRYAGRGNSRWWRSDTARSQ